MKEFDYNSMVGEGKIRFLPPRFMTVNSDTLCIVSSLIDVGCVSQVNTAIEQLLEVEALKGEVTYTPVCSM